MLSEESNTIETMDVLGINRMQKPGNRIDKIRQPLHSRYVATEVGSHLTSPLTLGPFLHIIN